MIGKKIIENQSEVQEILSTLEPTGKSTGYYSALFVNPATGDQWEKYLFESDDDHSDGIGLRKYPYPSFEETIRIALTSEFEDEVDGASAFICEHDNDGQAKRLLIEAIEEDIQSTNPDRFNIIYWRAELYDSTNKRPAVGKHYSEVTRDHAHFVELAERAKLLKQQING
jgi:hypothetical protein